VPASSFLSSPNARRGGVVLILNGAIPTPRLA